MNFVYLFFLAAAWLWIQCLIGGTRLLFSLPAYGILAIGAILTLASVRTRRIAPNAICLCSTLLLGGWVLYRSSHSPIQYLALPDFSMMIGCLMVYLLAAYHLTGMRERTIFIGVLWALAAVEVWCGLIQFLKDPGFMLFGLMRSQEIGRASGLFISPNHFAGLLEAVAILSLSMTVWSRWPVWAKILGLYMTLSCWLGVAISGSRGGYISSITALVAFSVGSICTIRLVDRRRFLPAVAGALAALALMVGVAVFLMGHSELLTRRMESIAARDVRIYNWEAALDHIRVSPWVGTGAGTHLIYGRLFRRPQIQADPVHAHCDYLELIAEYGAVGGLCMLLFLASHIRNGLKAFSQLLRRRLLHSGIARSNAFAMNFGVLCAVAGLGAHSVVDFNMHIPGNALFFAFLFGMLANPGLERTQGFLDRWVLPWGRLLLPALGGWMIWACLPLLPSEWCAEQARESLRDHKYLDAISFADIGLGRPHGEAPSNGAPFLGRPWLLYFGGIDGLINRFGPNPANPDIYFYLGEANRGLGLRMSLPPMKIHYFQEAIPVFRDGLAVFPQNENALVRLAQCLDGTGEYQAAEEVYQQCFKLDPNLAVIHRFYATHLLAEGRKEEAQAALQTANDLDNGEVDAEKKAGNALQ